MTPNVVPFMSLHILQDGGQRSVCTDHVTVSCWSVVPFMSLHILQDGGQRSVHRSRDSVMLERGTMNVPSHPTGRRAEKCAQITTEGREVCTDHVTVSYWSVVPLMSLHILQDGGQRSVHRSRDSVILERGTINVPSHPTGRRAEKCAQIT
ncbi:hypothetical protein BaRGS_00034864 [Batillaria attramentaria]|uniref:Uncharacterized protein n=1 Tax=Batillaria attramentaria TaxID=370345 RepID=A0ABD0JGB8_9CAEN